MYIDFTVFLSTHLLLHSFSNLMKRGAQELLPPSSPAWNRVNNTPFYQSSEVSGREKTAKSDCQKWRWNKILPKTTITFQKCPTFFTFHIILFGCTYCFRTNIYFLFLSTQRKTPKTYDLSLKNTKSSYF